MKILILGAGQIGSNLAEHLAHEGNEITLVDIDKERLDALNMSLDIRTVEGKASHPSVLRSAGCQDADLLIAVTNSDEINMLACEIANTLFNTPKKIARLRDREYLACQELYSKSAINVDVVISPEQLVTDSIARLIEFPGALQVLDFADGQVQLVAVQAVAGGFLVGQALSALHDAIRDSDIRVAAIYRDGEAITPQGDTVIQPKDEVFFIASRERIRRVMGELRKTESAYKRVFIAGGGNIGERLARQIQADYHVKLVEIQEKRCIDLAEQLTKTVVLHGSATRKQLLSEENIHEVDLYCALTNDDEDNIMSSLLAKKLGAKKVLTLITDPAYVDLIQGGPIDIALSPQQVTIGSILAHIRRGDFAKVHSLRRGAAEAIEAVVHGDSRSSRVVGRKIREIGLPKGAMIAAIVRDDEVIMGHGETVIESEDHVILFLADKYRVREVERLFQVGLPYFN
ncbi:MAG: Trk system potassium transporter TrkA [Halomonas sp.]|nr:Trk system potassium transporter TrkA [Halomonas sp.]